MGEESIVLAYIGKLINSEIPLTVDKRRTAARNGSEEEEDR